jgi:hypothetical protein
MDKQTDIEVVDQAAIEDMHAAGKVLGPYVFGKNLGQGTFGKVKMATHQLTQEPVSA